MTATKVKHPAPYSKAVLPVMATMLSGCATVLDPFAGIGRIHELAAHGFKTIGVELEPEWANMHPQTFCANALNLPFFDNTFDAIATSPTYGNRYADHHNAKDGSVRRSYTHDLGRTLHPDNSGAMQWGNEYRDFHTEAWMEALRVLKPGGRFILNIKDHMRGGVRQYVSGWHVTTLCQLGFVLLHHEGVPTPGMRMGANSAMRIKEEQVYAFQSQGDPKQ